MNLLHYILCMKLGTLDTIVECVATGIMKTGTDLKLITDVILIRSSLYGMISVIFRVFQRIRAFLVVVDVYGVFLIV